MRLRIYALLQKLRRVQPKLSPTQTIALVFAGIILAGALLLTVLFLGLVIPYISHYYFLENSVQALYKMYYEAVARVNG